MMPFHLVIFSIASQEMLGEAYIEALASIYPNSCFEWQLLAEKHS